MTGHAHSVVVGVDWSDAARAAVEHGAAAAADRHLPLHLVHVLEPAVYAVRPVVGRVDDLDLILRKAAGRPWRCSSTSPAVRNGWCWDPGGSGRSAS
jgi:nucleotide-binding universal stress UspA family protein